MIEVIKKTLPNEFAIPCELQILPQYIFMKSNPILIGVKIINGELYTGTTICTFIGKNMLILGRIEEIQLNSRKVESTKKGTEVSIKIVANEKKYTYDKDFNSENLLFTKLSPRILNALNILQDEYEIDWDLVKRIKSYE